MEKINKITFYGIESLYYILKTLIELGSSFKYNLPYKLEDWILETNKYIKLIDKKSINYKSTKILNLILSTIVGDSSITKNNYLTVFNKTICSNNNNITWTYAALKNKSLSQKV